MKTSNLKRFFSKVDLLPNGCWAWKGSFFNKKDYGQFYVREDGKDTNKIAHRWLWQQLNRELGQTEILCHKCDNPSCVNPDHLYVGTHQSNADDRERAGHTNRWDKRYNFKRSGELVDRVAHLRSAGRRVDDICTQLGIGRTTYYRVQREQLGQ
jgi:hypothetical protein